MQPRQFRVREIRAGPEVLGIDVEPGFCGMSDTKKESFRFVQNNYKHRGCFWGSLEEAALLRERSFRYYGSRTGLLCLTEAQVACFRRAIRRLVCRQVVDVLPDLLPGSARWGSL